MYLDDLIIRPSNGVTSRKAGLLIVKNPKVKTNVSVSLLSALEAFYASQRDFHKVDAQKVYLKDGSRPLIRNEYKIIKGESDDKFLSTLAPIMQLQEEVNQSPPDKVYGKIVLSQYGNPAKVPKQIELLPGQDFGITQQTERNFEPKKDPVTFYVGFFPTTSMKGVDAFKDRNDFLEFVRFANSFSFTKKNGVYRR